MGAAVFLGKIVLGDEGEAQIQGLRGLDDLLVAALGIHLQKEVEPGVFLADLDPIRQGAFAQLPQELIPKPPVVVAHPVDVLFKIALGEEAG